MDGLSGFFAAAFDLLKSLLPGIVGATMALRRVERKQGQHWIAWCWAWLVENMATFFCGVALAYYVGGASIEYAGIDPASFSADAIKIGIAIFGMEIIIQTRKSLPAFLSAIRSAMVDRVRGGAPSRSDSDKDGNGGA